MYRFCLVSTFLLSLVILFAQLGCDRRPGYSIEAEGSLGGAGSFGGADGLGGAGALGGLASQDRNL